MGAKPRIRQLEQRLEAERKQELEILKAQQRERGLYNSKWNFAPLTACGDFISRRITLDEHKRFYKAALKQAQRLRYYIIVMRPAAGETVPWVRETADGETSYAVRLEDRSSDR